MISYDDFLQAKLPSVLRIYRDTLTTDMKSSIKTAVAELLPVLATRPLDSEISSKDRVVDSDGESSVIGHLCWQKIDSYLFL